MSYYVFRTTTIITAEHLVQAVHDDGGTIYSVLGVLLRIGFAEGSESRILEITDRYMVGGKLLRIIRSLDKSNGIKYVSERYFNTMDDAVAMKTELDVVFAQNTKFQNENGMTGWFTFDGVIDVVPDNSLPTSLPDPLMREHVDFIVI